MDCYLQGLGSLRNDDGDGNKLHVNAICNIDELPLGPSACNIRNLSDQDDDANKNVTNLNI